MELLKTKQIKEETNNRLLLEKVNRGLLILGQAPSPESLAYRDALGRKCDALGIKRIYREFKEGEDERTIVDFCNDKEGYAYVILRPIPRSTNISIIQEGIRIRDLDGFSYISLGKILDGDYSYLPATSKAIAKILNYYKIDLIGKRVAIANSTNVIGRPLALYLNSRKATVTLLNSKTEDERTIIKNSDIFISAIGKMNFFDSSYFKNGQVLIDCGMTYCQGKLVGDINCESLSKLDLSLARNFGSLTSLCLLEGLLDKE